MPFWLFITLLIGAALAVCIPLYVIWWSWWDRRMQAQADELWPDADDEQQRATWQLLRALEGPRTKWRLKFDVSDLYARRHGRKP